MRALRRRGARRSPGDQSATAASARSDRMKIHPAAAPSGSAEHARTTLPGWCEARQFHSHRDCRRNRREHEENPSRVRRSFPAATDPRGKRGRRPGDVKACAPRAHRQLHSREMKRPLRSLMADPMCDLVHQPGRCSQRAARVNCQWSKEERHSPEQRTGGQCGGEPAFHGSIVPQADARGSPGTRCFRQDPVVTVPVAG